jgi:hypothetical protein
MPILTDLAIRNAKPAEKPLKLTDSKGLFLLMTPKGQKWWRWRSRLRYRHGSKEKMLSLGGLSPRARGNPGEPGNGKTALGPIPASAGEPAHRGAAC